MDDVRIQEIRAARRPRSNIAAMLEWLKQHPGPVYTSRPHDGYPNLVAFPLEDVINNLGFAYFNGTAAYAAAFAIHIGVKHISFFGCDFTYPNAHQSESGRGCLEYWIGYARAKGIRISISDKSSLLDSCAPMELLYGYDTLALTISEADDGRVTVSMKPREQLPSAEEIEARYDHSKHPSPLVKESTP